MSLTLKAAAGAVALCLVAAATAADDTPDNCAGDAAIQACVASAALTVRDIVHDGSKDLHVIVSVSLRLSNRTDYPLEIAFVQDDGKWSFTPQNAESIVPSSVSMFARRLEFAGATACSFKHGRDDCAYTQLSPGKPQLMQVSYSGRLTRNAVPLAQLATKASLSGLISVRERGAARFVPLPVPEFAFGNGVAAVR